MAQRKTFGYILSQKNVFVTQSCPTLCDPMDCSLPASSVHGILQAQMLEREAIPFSREFSQPRDGSQVFCIAGDTLSILWSRNIPHSMELMCHSY